MLKTIQIVVNDVLQNFSVVPEKNTGSCEGCFFDDTVMCKNVCSRVNCLESNIIFERIDPVSLTPEIIARVMGAYMAAENGWRDNEVKCTNEIIQYDIEYLAKEKLKADPEYTEFLRLAEKFKDIVL